jgi:hypothetical protein
MAVLQTQQTASLIVNQICGNGYANTARRDFRMLAEERAGRDYNKSEYRRSVIAAIGRKPGLSAAGEGRCRSRTSKDSLAFVGLPALSGSENRQATRFPTGGRRRDRPATCPKAFQMHLQMSCNKGKPSPSF